jgi:hypothetical protein
MDYKGIEYKILKTTTPHVWTWSASPPLTVPMHGSAASISSATFAARRAITKWLLAHRSEDETAC